MSDDAVPALVENMAKMDFYQQCEVKNKLLYRLETVQNNENDFRSWNWARWTARHKIARNIENLDTNGCPDYSSRYYDDF